MKQKVILKNNIRNVLLDCVYYNQKNHTELDDAVLNIIKKR